MSLRTIPVYLLVNACVLECVRVLRNVLDQSWDLVLPLSSQTLASRWIRAIVYILFTTILIYVCTSTGLIDFTQLKWCR